LAKYVSIYLLLAAELGFRFQPVGFLDHDLGLTGAEMTSSFPIKGAGRF
jgi:hypothetical protein